jgi:very-short-patch-repair endonuclease
MRIGPFVVDFLWQEKAVIVEHDGYRAHAGRSAFEADRARRRDHSARLRGDPH